MKKKGFFALLCAAGMCMTLAACGEEGGQPDLTADTDFEALVSDRVTEAEWDAAFTDEAFAGVTVELTRNSNTMHIKYGYEKDGDDFSVMKDAEDPARGSGQNTIYCFKADAVDTYFKFKGEDRPPYCEEGVWYVQTIEKDGEGWNDIHSETSIQWGNTFRGMVAYDFGGKFGEFTYDEAQGAYTFTGAMEIKYTPMEAMGINGGYTVSYATLKFSGGKLAYAKVKVTNGDEEVYNYYDYGKTQVVIPTDAQPMPEE